MLHPIPPSDLVLVCIPVVLLSDAVASRDAPLISLRESTETVPPSFPEREIIAAPDAVAAVLDAITLVRLDDETDEVETSERAVELSLGQPEHSDHADQAGQPSPGCIDTSAPSM